MARKKEFVDIKAAGDRSEYAAVLTKIKKDGVCPFCPAHFKYHTRPILQDGKYWLATENMAPYTGTKHHFLLLHKKHIEHVTDISPKAWEELLVQIKWLCKKYKLPAGSFFMRFGDKRYTGASVTQHVHAQMFIGSPKSKKTYPLSPLLGHSRVPYTPPKKR
jgi:diadenosine tetraphosphate (Ap4A) HIT family hydrolase